VIPQIKEFILGDLEMHVMSFFLNVCICHLICLNGRGQVFAKIKWLCVLVRILLSKEHCEHSQLFCILSRCMINDLSKSVYKGTYCV